MPETAAHIIIDPSIDPQHFEEAQKAALELEVAVSHAPEYVSQLISRTEPILEDPAAHEQMLDNTGVQGNERHVAGTLLALLRHTADGSFLDFDDTTAAELSHNGRHQQLVELSRNTEHRHVGDPRVNRRRVAISGLRAYIGRHSQAHGSPAPTQGEVA
jgi:hypothetical protein